MTLILVFLVLAVMSFGIRIYSRRINKSILDASDYFCSIAMVSMLYLKPFLNIIEVSKGLCVGLAVILWGGKIPQE